MKYTNEKWFEAQAELVVHNIKANRSDDEKKYWIKQALKKAYTEGMHKEIILKALENNNK